ncbi:MAG TPA: YkgJ family cysteine cluster protein [Candidatus Rubrimentiphilum sp.]|nr:YkgJ family cysteine cluster protein [Candidatus Rubrimentiphilum sp.]
MNTIDLIGLRRYTRDTGQPTHPEMVDTTPMERVQDIEIDQEHITITYNQHINHYYNTNENIEREWVYKYNDDPEFVAAIAKVIELARKHLQDLPDNIACPPGCAECCSGYEPFVSRGDVDRIAAFLHLAPQDVLDEYVVKRKSADGYHLGWLRKVTDDVADQCVFLKESAPGRYYCGIYEARPQDCRDFSPIGCTDVNDKLPRDKPIKIGPPFQPKHRKNNSRRRR